jgi:hypothetical protein
MFRSMLALACSTSMVLATGAGPWAYAPIGIPAVPAVVRADWPRGEIDRFILSKMEAAGLEPAADADRATLARRLTFALHGLPPTPEQVEALIRDGSADAVERFVDALLASPRFGEHWGRHWLDVARFGQSLTLRGFVFEEAWRYRDYVIEAFNRDLPYDRFVREQLAGDLMAPADLGDRQRAMVATTFLALGNTNLEEQNKRLLEMDVVDEQLDTLGKAFFGQALGCARCHDHKFDPIPMRDYYALAGILKSSRQLEHANVSKWLERPLPLEGGEEARLAAQEQAVAALEAEIKAAKAVAGAATDPGRAGVVAASALPGAVVDSAAARAVGAWKASTHFPRYVGEGYLHDDRQGKGEKTLTFEPSGLAPGEYDVRLAYIPGGGRDRAVPVTVFHAQGETEVAVDQEAEPPIDGRWVSLGRYRFETAGFGHVLVATAGTTGYVTADAVQFLPVGDAANGGEPAVPSSTAKDEAGARVRTLESKLKELKAAQQKRPMVMTVVETGKPADLPLHRRGSVDSLGEPVPRGVLSVVASVPAPTMPADQSGRLQLAEWAVHPAHPLTARVMANRIWLWLFGDGLVRTPDNFGTTGEAPTHPELLDFLASRFRDDGWSVKRLVRSIVLSRTWQLRSEPTDASLRIDPSNRLWSHTRPHRLRAEEWRDAMLLASGQLSLETGGPNHPAKLDSDFGYVDSSVRRSVYVPVFRNARPDVFEAFDAASPSLVTGRREESTVATQALLLLNHPWIREQAAAAAARLAGDPAADPVATLDAIYLSLLARPPSDGERRLALAHLGPDPTHEAWTSLIHALWASVDFRFVR